MTKKEFWEEIHKIMLSEGKLFSIQVNGERFIDFDAYLLSLPIVHEDWWRNGLSNGSSTENKKDIVVKTEDGRLIRFSVFKHLDGNYHINLHDKKAKYPQFVVEKIKTIVTYKGI